MVLAAVNPGLTMTVIVCAIALMFCGLWWLQATMAERGNRENPQHPGGDERIDELEHERRAATETALTVGAVAAVVLAIAVLFIIF